MDQLARDIKLLGDMAKSKYNNVTILDAEIFIYPGNVDSAYDDIQGFLEANETALNNSWIVLKVEEGLVIC